MPDENEGVGVPEESLTLDASPASRESWKAVLSSIGEAVFVVHPVKRRIVMANAAAGRLFGIAPAALVGTSLKLLFASSEAYERMSAEMAEVVARGRTYRGEVHVRRAEGGIFRAQLTTSAIDDDRWQEGVVTVVRDISDLRAAQDRVARLLGALESRVRKLRAVRQVATILTDQDQPLAVALQRAVDVLPDALGHGGRAWASITWAGETFTAGKPEKMSRQELEARFEDLEGREGTVRAAYARDDPSENGGLPEAETLVESVAFLLQSHCNTRAQNARTRRERDRFFTLFRSSPVATALSEVESGVFVDVNDTWVAITGRQREEFLGRSSVALDMWIDPGERARLLQQLQEDGSVDDFRVRFRNRDGEERHAFGSVHIIDLDGHEYLFSTLHDVTEKVRAEEQKARMAEQRAALERLGAIGELAGGVAHDINNLLLPILVNVELALLEVPEDVKGQLQEVRDAAKRGRDLTSKLLSFSGKQTLQKEPLDPGPLVTSFLPTFRRLVPETVAVEIRADRGVPRIYADPGQMELVLINLVLNARDAMGGQGRIVVSAMAGEPPTDRSFYGTPDPRGVHVYLCVADEGRGIDPEILPRIFEPFFTTKENATGTGLGLSSALGIVEQHGGHIVVETRQGHGTTFRLGFPVHAPTEEDVDEARVPDLTDRSIGEGRTVLVAEDDPSVRKVTARALRSFGYAVLEAEDGAAALRTVESREDGLDLIISDMVMPGMTGLDLRDALVEIRPEIPILFVSGYSAATLAEHGVEGDSVRILEKPFTPRQLVEAVYAKLSESDPSR